MPGNRIRLEPGEQTLKDCFDRSHRPVAVVEAGEAVSYRLLDAGWSLTPMPAPGVHGRRWLDRNRFEGHALIGPVQVRGTRPGDALEVRIERIRPAEWGWTRAGGIDADLYRRLGVASGVHWQLWSIDAGRGVAVDQAGRSVRIAPFLGVMGNAPAAPGRHSTTPPRRVGGNLDLRELTEGSTLFLPVEVEGALFYCGDGHAAQGDGEVAGTAIECPMQDVRLSFRPRRDLRLTTPLARTAGAWIAIGCAGSVDEAVFIALNAMLDLMVERLGVDRAEALALASACVDLRVTQVVNMACGAHAILRDDALLIPDPAG